MVADRLKVEPDPVEQVHAKLPSLTAGKPPIPV